MTWLTYLTIIVIAFIAGIFISMAIDIQRKKPTKVRNGWPPDTKAMLLVLWALAGWIALPVAVIFSALIYAAGAALCN